MFLAPSFVLSMACTPPPDARTIEHAIATAVPMAWVGTHAIDAYDGVPSPCVEWETECLTAPCVGAFELVPDEACPLPIAGQLDGAVTVTVAGGDEDGSALFGAYFGDLTSDGADLWLESADGALATRNAQDLSDEVTDIVVSFTDLEVEVPDGGVDLIEAAWVVYVDEAGTPGEPADDTLQLQGASQWVQAHEDTASAKQTVLTDVTFTPDCRRNPTGGGGGIANSGAENATESGSPVTYDLVTVLFHEACDGQAEILAAGTGGSQGGSFTLSLER